MNAEEIIEVCKERTIDEHCQECPARKSCDELMNALKTVVDPEGLRYIMEEWIG